MKRPIELSRRGALKRMALGVGGASAAGGLVMYGVQPGSGASFSAGNFGGLQDVSIKSSAGNVNWIAVKAAMRATWDGFEEAVHYFQFVDEVVVAPNTAANKYLIHATGKAPDGGMGDGRQSGEWGGDSGWHGWSKDGNGGEDFSDTGKAGYVHADIDWGILQKNRNNIYNEGYPLPENPAPTSGIENPDDGTTAKTAVKFIKRVRLYDAGGHPLTGPNAPGWGPSDAKISGSFVVSVTNEEASTSAAGASDGTSGDGNNEEPL